MVQLTKVLCGYREVRDFKMFRKQGLQVVLIHSGLVKLVDLVHSRLSRVIVSCLFLICIQR